LLSIHKGAWDGKRILDGREVSIISPYLEEGQDAGEPSVLSESQNQIYQGSIFLGDGFLLSHAEKEKLVDADQRNQKIIAPVINGEDVSSDPKQGHYQFFKSH
jgi:hypothetical protein